MKNNIILKGMFLLALCVVHAMNAKSTRQADRQPTDQPKITGRNVPVAGIKSRITRTPTEERTQANLSPAAKFLIDESRKHKRTRQEIEENFEAMERQGFKFTQADVIAIDKEIEKSESVQKESKQTKEKSALLQGFERLEKMIMQKDEEIKNLNRRLALQDKGILMNLYESAAGSVPYAALSGATGATALALGAGGVLATGGALAVGGAAAGLMSAWNYIKKGSQTGQFSDSISAWLGKNAIMHDILDKGRYPTYKSQIDGVNKDMMNVSGLDENLFEESRRNALNNVMVKQAEAFKVPGVKEEEEKIDKAIADIAAKYYDQDSQKYMQKLASIKEKEVNLAYARAIVSEYLRAAFRFEQQKLAVQEKAKREKEAEAAKSQVTSPWWRMGG